MWDDHRDIGGFQHGGVVGTIAERHDDPLDVGLSSLIKL